MWGNGASFATFWFKIQENSHSGRYITRKGTGYFEFTAPVVTPITYAVLKAVFEGELEGPHWFEIRVLQGLMPVLAPQKELVLPDIPSDLPVPGAVLQIELTLVLPSLIRWHGSPASGHKSIPSVPLMSLMKYFRHLSEREFSKSCSELWSLRDIGAPNQFTGTRGNKKCYITFLKDMRMLSPTLGLKVILRWQLI